jgi:hypothetical protein
MGRLSWIAGWQVVPVTMPKTISLSDDNAEDDVPSERRYQEQTVKLVFYVETPR